MLLLFNRCGLAWRENLLPPMMRHHVIDSYATIAREGYGSRPPFVLRDVL